MMVLDGEHHGEHDVDGEAVLNLVLLLVLRYEYCYMCILGREQRNCPQN
jgi:hypothetical protein